jgi:hypothetical protein
MATAVATSAPARQNLASRDRIFYTSFAVAMAIAVFVGFSRTFYLREQFGNPPVSPLFMIHGALFTTWILLFITQTVLVASHKVAIHRKLGYAGAALAAIMFFVGCFAAITACKLGRAPLGIPPLKFLVIPIADMLCFVAFTGAAVWLRRDKEAHKRYMLVGTIALLGAAFARWPFLLGKGPLYFYGAADLFLVAAIAYDVFSRGKVHKAYIWSGVLMIASQPLRLVLSGTSAWDSFARFLTR